MEKHESNPHNFLVTEKIVQSKKRIHYQMLGASLEILLGEMSVVLTDHQKGTYLAEKMGFYLES